MIIHANWLVTKKSACIAVSHRHGPLHARLFHAGVLSYIGKGGDNQKRLRGGHLNKTGWREREPLMIAHIVSLCRALPYSFDLEINGARQVRVDGTRTSGPGLSLLFQAYAHLVERSHVMST